MLVSIVMPCRNEERYLRSAVESVYASTLDHDDFELIIVDGMSTDGTRAVIQELQQYHANIVFLDNPHLTVSYAMNEGIRHAKGEYLIRIDAHCEYPRNYFAELIKHHRMLEADNVGTAIESTPKNSTKKSESIAKVLSDPFGVGDSRFRTGVQEIRQVDTVPFGCYRREIFDRIGFYDERLTKSQDIELNRRITRAGGKIYILPHVKLTYYIRESWGALAKKYIGNGMWNVFVAKYTGKVSSLSLRNYVPMIFVAGILTLSVASFMYRPALIALGAVLSIYAILIGIRSVAISSKNTRVIYLMYSFFVLHFSHGFGGVLGLFHQFFLPSTKESDLRKQN
jgi:glycosyltransferase involved in cell wall biosynthesis